MLTLPPLLKAMRPTQWPKNFFVLAPLVFAGKLFDPAALGRSALAFAVFCAASSAVYLANDIRDREADRRHPLKRHRPLAAGTLTVAAAVGAALLLAALAGVGAWELGGRFALVLAIYFGLNVCYTLGLKDVVILDVLLVSFGFVLRVLAGGAAIEVEISRWLTLCTIFVALFLVLSKRRHEITLLTAAAAQQRQVLAHYNATFLDQMINVVTASAVVSYALYAVAPGTEQPYDNHLMIYTLPLVLFGIFRYLFLVYQATDARNPTEALLSDPPFLVNLVLWAAAVTWIVYGG